MERIVIISMLTNSVSLGNDTGDEFGIFFSLAGNTEKDGLDIMSLEDIEN